VSRSVIVGSNERTDENNANDESKIIRIEDASTGDLGSPSRWQAKEFDAVSCTARVTSTPPISSANWFHPTMISRPATTQRESTPKVSIDDQ
jgi:hypothetical protein